MYHFMQMLGLFTHHTQQILFEPVNQICEQIANTATQAPWGKLSDIATFKLTLRTPSLVYTRGPSQ